MQPPTVWLLFLVVPALSGCVLGEDADESLDRRAFFFGDVAHYVADGVGSLDVHLDAGAANTPLGVDGGTTTVTYRFSFDDGPASMVVQEVLDDGGAGIAWSSDCPLVVATSTRDPWQCFDGKDRVRWYQLGAGLPGLLGASLAASRGVQDGGGIVRHVQVLGHGVVSLELTPGGVDGCLQMSLQAPHELPRRHMVVLPQELDACGGWPTHVVLDVPGFLGGGAGGTRFERVGVDPGEGGPLAFRGIEAPAAVRTAAKTLNGEQAAVADVSIPVDVALEDGRRMSNEFRAALERGAQVATYRHQLVREAGSPLGLADNSGYQVILAVRDEAGGHEVVLEYDRLEVEQGMPVPRLVEERSVLPGPAYRFAWSLDDLWVRLRSVGDVNDSLEYAHLRDAGSAPIDPFVAGAVVAGGELEWLMVPPNTSPAAGVQAFFPYQAVGNDAGDLVVIDVAP